MAAEEHGPHLPPPCTKERVDGGQGHCLHAYELVFICCWCGRLVDKYPWR